MEQAQGAVNVARFESPTPREAELLARNGVRVEADVSGIGILAEHQVCAAVPAEFHALGNRRRMAHAFDHYVGSEAAGRIHDSLASYFDRVFLINRDDFGGAECQRLFEPVRGPSDRDHF